MTAKVIAMLQKKGGASKTTTSINLMMALREQGHNAIVCDMDKEKPDAIFWADNGEELSNFIIPLFESNPMPQVENMKKQYDYIILDTPPQLEAAALKAALIADIAIIPSSPSALDENALESAAECAIMAKIPFKFLASRVVKNTHVTSKLMASLTGTGECFNTKVTHSVAMLEAQDSGLWIGSYKPNGANHLQYKELAQEVMSLFKS